MAYKIGDKFGKRLKQRFIKEFVGAWAKDNEQELEIAGKLLNRWPEIEFWRSLPLDHNPRSLAAFLSDSSISFLNREYGSYLTAQKNAQTSKIKLDSLAETTKNREAPSQPFSSPGSILDFLNK